VEGKNDVQSLCRLGVTGDFVLAKTAGKSFLDVLGEVEQKESGEVILLFDFDRRGKEWTSRMARRLEGTRIVPNLLFWRMFLGLVGRDVKDIEGLAAYLGTLRARTGKS
jgi:5S rRNA maturation endonuclease (ribonuclease M5)